MKWLLTEAVNGLWFLLMGVPFMPSLFVNSATLVLLAWHELKAFDRRAQAWWDENVPSWVQPVCMLINIVWALICLVGWVISLFR